MFSPCTWAAEGWKAGHGPARTGQTAPNTEVQVVQAIPSE